MDSSERLRLTEATGLACDWHGAQTRKGSPVSYLSHLLQVSGLVLEHGGDLDEAVAALLHDSLEDAANGAEAELRVEVIRSRFGVGVLEIVRDCSDTLVGEAGAEKGPWKQRKLRYIEQLSAASDRSRRVAACDKLHNLGTLVQDIRVHGPEYLARFNAGASEQIWYFESLRQVFEGHLPRALQLRLDESVEAFKRAVS